MANSSKQRAVTAGAHKGKVVPTVWEGAAAMSAPDVVHHLTPEDAAILGHALLREADVARIQTDRPPRT